MKSNKVYDIFGKRKIFFAIPIVVIVITLLLSLIMGVEVDIEFKGGTLINYTYIGELDTAAMKSTVEELGHGTVNISTGSALSSDLQTVTLSFASNDGLTADVQNEISTKVIEQFAANELTLQDSQDVNPSTGTMFFVKCLVAVLFSFVLLVIYIAFRFKKIGGFSAGVFSLVALMHDVIIVYATFVILRMPLDANFMAVILTILGYSINNTIVIYDRVRENRILQGKRMGIVELMNSSVSQTLTRSINTTITTVFAALSICVVALICGVNSIISFALPLLVGLLAGFYSSVFISGPLWVMWQQHKLKKAPEKK